MIHLVNYGTKRTLLRVDLSDCWTYNGKRIWFRLRKLQSPIDDDVKAISFVLGPLSVKFGWCNNGMASAWGAGRRDAVTRWKE